MISIDDLNIGDTIYVLETIHYIILKFELKGISIKDNKKILRVEQEGFIFNLIFDTFYKNIFLSFNAAEAHLVKELMTAVNRYISELSNNNVEDYLQLDCLRRKSEINFPELFI